MFRSLIASFSMFSRLPMPPVDWEDEKSKKYILWFFPFVGLVQGLILWGISTLLTWGGAGRMLYGAIMCAAPVIINGGIHMDGFLDTIDAMNAFADRKRRLEILKDSHCGAFAVIYAVVYLIMSAGIWGAMGHSVFPEVILVFMMSRTLSAAGLVIMPPARGNGSAHSMVSACDRRNTRTALIIMFILECAVMCLMTPVSGLVCGGVSLFIFWHYTYVGMKYFGGVTGDIAGYFLQLCELSCLAALTGIVLAVKLGAGGYFG